MAYANMTTDMPLRTKLRHFWDLHQARFLEKKSKAWENMQNDAMLRFGYFPEKRVLNFLGLTDQG